MITLPVTTIGKITLEISERLNRIMPEVEKVHLDDMYLSNAYYREYEERIDFHDVSDYLDKLFRLGWLKMDISARWYDGHTVYKIRSYCNEDEKFWKHSYLVSLAQCLGWDSSILVNADNEQEALDFAVDYAEEQGWEGYFIQPEDESDYIINDELIDVITAGNHGRLLPSWEVNIRQLD